MLLSIPRVVGIDPADDQEIVAHNGKFGPYLKKGTDSRSLVSEDQLLAITLDEALAVFAQPKTRGRNAKAPLRDMGADPVTGLPMLVKDGRFGPYVTDGTTNASLRVGDDVESLTVERAAELLADRRAAGPSKKKAVKKKAPAKKKTAAKKATAKKTTAKKATAKKATTKKAAATKKATSLSTGAVIAVTPLSPDPSTSTEG
jgi:DNA topoisomerase-1